jgi:hydrogenase/urease accessory protein HupE
MDYESIATCIPNKEAAVWFWISRLLLGLLVLLVVALSLWQLLRVAYTTGFEKGYKQGHAAGGQDERKRRELLAVASSRP